MLVTQEYLIILVNIYANCLYFICYFVVVLCGSVSVFSFHFLCGDGSGGGIVSGRGPQWIVLFV